MASHYEPGSIKDIEETLEYNAYREMLHSQRWHKLFVKVCGHNNSISLSFAQGFYHRVIRFKDIVMEVVANTIVEATGLPQTGEKMV